MSDLYSHRTLIELELVSALQGDAESIKAVAERLAGAALPPADDGRVPIANFQAAVNERADFLNAVDIFNSEYQDILERADTRQLAKEADTQLAAQHPDWPYLKRLRAAGNMVRQAVDEQEGDDEVYRGKVIAYMKESRAPRNQDDEATELHNPTSDDYANRRRDEFDEDRANAIAQMKGQRERAREDLGD